MVRANDLSLEPFNFPEGGIVHTPTHPGNGIEGTRVPDDDVHVRARSHG